MNKDNLRQITIVLLSITQLITNALGGSGFNGRSIGEVSDSFITAFIPAGLTFAVWGPIYLGITAYAVYQALPGQANRAIHRRIGWLAAITAAGNAAWTPLFVTGNVTISLVVMLVMLTCLASIFVVLKRMRGELTTADKWAAMIPFSGYFAWITVATVANVTTTLLSLGFEGAGIPADIWSIAVTLVALGITTTMVVYSRGHLGTLAYGAVLVWAFVGVYLGNGDTYTLVGVVALVAAAVIAVATIWRFWGRRPAEPSTGQMATA